MIMDRVNGQDSRRTACYQSAGTNEKAQGKQEGVESNKQEKNTDSIFAGDLELGQNDILAKKEQMKKSAMKVLMDAFSGEQEIDENLDAHRSNIEELENEADNASGELHRIRNLKQELKETCNIEDDSEEQKDLELLEKKDDFNKRLSSTPLTEEEEERIKNMGPLTEYQTAAMEYHDMESTWRKRLTNAKDTITLEHRTIEAIQVERLKTHNIVDASKESQKILDTASEEAVGSLLEEVKDNIDEKIEDNADKTEEIKEKEQQEEALKSANKKDVEKKANEDKASTEQMEQVQKQGANWEKVQREIKAIVDKEMLLSEDIKGLTVDEQL